jgi:hypothetical protein
MSRPTVTVISAKGESTKDTVTVPNVFKVSSELSQFAIWGIIVDTTHTYTSWTSERNGTMEKERLQIKSGQC